MACIEHKYSFMVLVIWGSCLFCFILLCCLEYFSFVCFELSGLGLGSQRGDFC